MIRNKTKPSLNEGFFVFIIPLQFFISFSFFPGTATAQNMGIGTLTPDSSALLELKSSDKGILIPRMSAAQRTAITNPAVGLLVYDTDSACFFFYKQPASWLSLCSLQGSQGPIGATGVTGVAGPTGTIGITGPTGAQGMQGNIGATGFTGIAGATGITGTTGPTGSQGIQGVAGTTGPSGGPIGPTGPTGIVNVQTYGVNGTGSILLGSTYQVIPGLSQTINLTAQATLNIFSSGTMEVTSMNTNAFNVDIGIYINNSLLINGIQNLKDSFFNTYKGKVWSIATITSLPAGTYTFEIRGKENNNNAIYAGTTSSSFIIQVFY